MNRVKKILLAILIVLIVIQVIQPARNKSGQVSATDMATMYKMPDTVQAVFKAASFVFS